MRLGPVRVGGGNPVRLMGVINTSPESFHGGSVRLSRKSIAGAARQMDLEGADIIDIGGMSTAPYLKTMVPERTESARVTRAIGAVQDATNLPISVDTCRSGVAREALRLGADIINDISGLKHDPSMVRVLSEHHPSVVLCAFGGRAPAVPDAEPAVRAGALLAQSVRLAKQAGIGAGRIVLDPSIGFFRRRGRGVFTRDGTGWFERDQAVIRGLHRVGGGFPLLVSVSNKSVVGRLFGIDDPPSRVPGSVTLEAICVLNGADVIRTHNVAYTAGAVRAAERIGRRGSGRGRTLSNKSEL